MYISKQAENYMSILSGDDILRPAHTAIRCNECQKWWLWGLSWDGSMDGKFICSDCQKPKCSAYQCTAGGYSKDETGRYYCESHYKIFES